MTTVGRAGPASPTGPTRRTARPRTISGDTTTTPEFGLAVIDASPGSGPRLHKYPYKEVFVLRGGAATFTAGEGVTEASAGQVMVVPAGVPHKLVNSGGAGRLPRIDLRACERSITGWLED